MKAVFLSVALWLVPCNSVAKTYSAVVVRVVDGDTVDVRVKAWANTPFEVMGLRVNGIDTPESMAQFAHCPKELALGLAAKAFAKTLTKPGDRIRFVYLGHDKYFRIDATVYVPPRRSWANIMLRNGMARVYSGGAKSDWCG